METIKLHWNSVLSSRGAKYATGDISNMYLMSDLPDAKYVRFCFALIPSCIVAYYHLNDFVVDGFVYAKVKKAWYGLKQAGKIAHDNLVQHLSKHGYVKAAFTDGLFFHKTRNISFTLVVDNFGIKYTKGEDLHHLETIMNL